jgi:hypothetical protein
MPYSSAYLPPIDRHQVGVAAHLGHPGPVQDHDQVGHPDGGEPVRHQHRDPPVGHLLAGRRGEPLEQGVLGLRVEGGRGLVQHQQQRLVPHEAAGQRELLPLPERHLDPRPPAPRPKRTGYRCTKPAASRSASAAAARSRRSKIPRRPTHRCCDAPGADASTFGVTHGPLEPKWTGMRSTRDDASRSAWLEARRTSRSGPASGARNPTQAGPLRASTPRRAASRSASREHTAPRRQPVRFMQAPGVRPEEDRLPVRATRRQPVRFAGVTSTQRPLDPSEPPQNSTDMKLPTSVKPTRR